MRTFGTLLVIGSFLLVAGNVGAQGLSSRLDSAKWNQLVKLTVQKGSQMDMEDGNIYRTLSNIVPTDMSKPHTADYFSTVGTFFNGVYDPYAISTVFENWKIDSNGNWDIDQWIYAVSVQGDLAGVAHNHLVEQQDGRVLGDDTVPNGGIKDPAVIQHWNQELSGWYARELSGGAFTAPALR